MKKAISGNYYKWYALPDLLIVFLFSLSVNASESEAFRPNIVLILTDDQGSVDMNCYGATDLITPNMDALAARGVRFTQFYVAAPVCSPSRAALLTGRYPQRAQLDRNAYGDRGLPPGQLTIAELLKEAGYRTAVFGKWHLGDDSALSPLAQGFDEFFGIRVGCIDNYSHFFYWQGPNRHDLWRNDTEHFENGAYFPDLIVREAQRFIGENKERPFFLYLPFNMPHYPMQAEQPYYDLYPEMKDLNRRRYAAFVSALDERIGRVIKTLDDQQLTGKTIIILLSDNGHSVEERAFGGGGSAGPYRGHKFTLWEGGIRLPCIISWPGTIPQGEVRKQIACSIDLFPTIAGYCGAALPPRRLDGLDIHNLIMSAASVSPHQILYWMKDNNWAVRKGRWKYVSQDEEKLLSDMEKDVTETKNLAAEHPDIVRELTELHMKWVKEVLIQ